MLTDCPDTIDHTAGSMLDECDRSYYYFQVRGLRPIYERDFFIAGKAWDRALGFINDPTKEFVERLRKAQEVIYATYASAKCDFISEKRSPENLIHLLDKYLEHFGSEPKYDVLDSNVRFRLPYKDFFIGGEVDTYLDWPKLGVVYNENKTTAMRITDSYTGQFYLGGYANQLRTYNWACRQITEDLWGAQVTIASLDIPKRATTERLLFQRLMIQTSEEQIQDILELYERRMNRLRYNWKHNSWPKTGTHCNGGWGFSPCDYRYICRLTPRLGEEEIEPYRYRVAQWRPWDGDKGDWENLSSEERDALEERLNYESWNNSD